MDIKEPHFRKVMKKMCKMVGADYEKVDPTKTNWMLEYSWTEKQENEFIEWFADYLYTNTSARNAIMATPYKSKTATRSCAQFFMFNYGWKLK